MMGTLIEAPIREDFICAYRGRREVGVSGDCFCGGWGRGGGKKFLFLTIKKKKQARRGWKFDV